jgi:hypothetical protein
MKLRHVGSFVVAATIAGSATAHAQTPRIDMAFYPVGHLVATAGDAAGQPEFRNLAPAAAVGVNLSSFFAVEGEVSAALGVTQQLNGLGRAKSPTMIGYSGNLIANLAPKATVQPYLAVGVGQMRLFTTDSLGINEPETVETANAGGGVKVMFGRWGLRGDYRFVGMSSTAQAASGFFGSDVRHAHRMSVGFIVSPGRGGTPRP